MAKFHQLIEALSENSNQSQENGKKADASAFNRLDTMQKSLAIVKTIDKLKARGVPLTKKAELDYLLARQFLEKAHIDPSSPNQAAPASSTPGSSPPIKRNPGAHPEEFKKALDFSRQIVAQVEELLKEGKPVPLQQMEAYELGKKFLEKYT